jgi:putative ABC transport system permease protein
VEYYSGLGYKTNMTSEKKNIRPPQWAKRFLYWYCRPELAEDLEGDLNEYFERNLKNHGTAKAKWIYVIDVIKFLRSYTFRRPDLNLSSQWSMVGSYAIVSGRSIVRNRLFSTINIAGLAISMSVGLLLIVLLSDLRSYDKFHQNYNRIYRVISQNVPLGKPDDSYYASTSLLAGKEISESISGPQAVAVLYRGFDQDLKFGDKTLPISGLWANENFFKVFSFSLVSGNSATALSNPYSVVLTETSAKKLFGDEDPLGKTITGNGSATAPQYTVTGIMKDVPKFSHLQFEILTSLSSREITEKDNKYEMAWDNIWSGYVYVLLPEKPDLQNIQHNLDELSAQQNQTLKNHEINLALQPMTDIAFGDDLNNSVGPVMDSSHVWMIGILSFIVILSACFNYTNLSIARSLRRSREVGIRKVVGALRSQVVGQFLVEAIIIALLALVLSFGIFVLLRPFFISLNGNYNAMLFLDVSPKVLLYFLLFAISVGIIAGLFPALFFARVNAIHVLKNISSTRIFRNLTVRKALIVAQFTISLMFIAATIIGFKHYKNVLAFDYGFDTENVFNIRVFGNKTELLKKELSEIGEVTRLSTSSIVTSLGNYSGTFVRSTDPHDSSFIFYNNIDENYLILHNHTILAGRNFISHAENATESEVIVNERLLKRFNIGNPKQAIGEFIIVDRKKLQIVGVVKDFQFGKSTDEGIREFVLRYSPSRAQYVNAKILSTDWPTTFQKIEAAWKKIDPVHPLEASFYDQQIENSYKDFSSRIKMIGTLSVLAICIAGIGLLGMVVFTTETRVKEISIRKVHGATVANIIFMLSRNFLILLALAAIIALPLTHFFFAKYALDEYAERAPVPFEELSIGVTLVIGLAFLLISTQTLKVAKSNPAEVLKSE